jgi:peptidyl-prolyl cis-trans isomerase A (cyclophilin A)
MEVVKAIMQQPRSPTAGEGAMKGQMLEPTVKLSTVRRAPPVQAPVSVAPGAQ